MHEFRIHSLLECQRTQFLNFDVYVECKQSLNLTDNYWPSFPFLFLGRSSDYLGHNPPRAFHTCTNNGQWGTLNTAQCQYQSEKTKVLEQFAKVSAM